MKYRVTFTGTDKAWTEDLATVVKYAKYLQKDSLHLYLQAQIEINDGTKTTSTNLDRWMSLQDKSLSSIDNENKEIRVYFQTIITLLTFVGEGVSSIDILNGDVVIAFHEAAHGNIDKAHWDKAETILNYFKDKNGFEDFNIISSHNKIVLSFDEIYPLGGY